MACWESLTSRVCVPTDASQWSQRSETAAASLSYHLRFWTIRILEEGQSSCLKKDVTLFPLPSRNRAPRLTNTCGLPQLSVIGFRSGPVSELTIHWDNCSCCGYMNHLWYKIRDKHDRKGKDASWSILDFPVVLYDPSLWKLVFHAVLGGKKQLPTPKIGTSFGTWTTKWGYSMRGSISFEVFRNSDYFKKAKYIDIQQLQKKKRETAHLFPGCCLSSSVQSISSIL